jgi:hypothetical protein
MGTIAKHTDLSAEFPGPRADMDLPLLPPADIEIRPANGAASDWSDAWIWPGSLEDLEPL